MYFFKLQEFKKYTVYPLIFMMLMMLQGCGLTPAHRAKVAELKAQRVQRAPELAPKTLNLLISQCALVLQNKNVDRNKLLEAGYTENPNLIGGKSYSLDNYKTSTPLTRVIYVSFVPKGIFGDCGFEINHGPEVTAIVKEIAEIELLKNGFSRLENETGLFKGAPKYRIGNVTVQIGRAIKLDVQSVIFSFKKV